MLILLLLLQDLPIDDLSSSDPEVRDRATAAIVKADFHWWVRERSLVLIGLAGDDSVLPTLREVLRREVSGEARDREIYHAVNAATRLLGRDVREKPVEEMDLDATRKKVLELLDK